MIQAKVALPNTTTFQDQDLLEKSAKLELKRAEHPGEVNRARYSPHEHHIVATKTLEGPVKLFDMEKGICIKNLLGHSEEGYGIDWNRVSRGILASCADDERVCVWDVEKSDKPIHILNDHHALVEDVSWSKFNESILLSCGDDKRIIINDFRAGQSAQQFVTGHESEVNCIDTNPHDEFLFIAGDTNQKLALWDFRQLTQPLHVFEGHKEEVYSVEWSPHFSNIFASSGIDRRVIIWDLERIGGTQSQEDAEDGPPEILFIHGGHTAKINDISWNPDQPWTIASVAEDNILHIWSPSEGIYKDEPTIERIPDSELE